MNLPEKYLEIFPRANQFEVVTKEKITKTIKYKQKKLDSRFFAHFLNTS